MIHTIFELSLFILYFVKKHLPLAHKNLDHLAFRRLRDLN